MLLGAVLVGISTITMAKTWTLRDCINYAVENNITIRKNRVTEQTGVSTLKQNKSALWPSISFSTSHSFTSNPLEDSGGTIGSSGEVKYADKISYNGQYGINANWTVWNGGINRKNITAQKITNEINELKTETSELTIQESIIKLYAQIMYTREAVKVNEALVKTAQAQYDRCVEMQKQGLKAKADVIALEAQLASAKYDVVDSKTKVDDYKRQLKALLQLDMTEDFDISGEIPADERALEAIPEATEVYSTAVATRPEIKSAEKSIESANVQYDIARRGYYPTIGVTASLSDNHNTMSDLDFATKLKNNFGINGGVSLSVPIWDQRKTKTNKEKALLQKTSAQLDLQDTKDKLSSQIEQYWLNAKSGQQKFVSAETKVKSQRTSFELTDEQFRNGLKNVVDVLESRDKILSAEQDKLQSKYTTLLNAQLLKFYKGEELDL